MSALQVKYRPKTLKGFYGNEATKSSLEACLAKNDIPTTFLFTGPAGTGKTTLGRIIGNTLEIDPIQVNIYNAASTRGIDTIREVIEKALNGPGFVGGKRRIFIFEECHGLTGTALEALLDFMEHPPADVYIVLTTTEPSSLKPTIKRRCHQYEVKPLPDEKMEVLLQKISTKEKIEIDPEVMKKIVEASQGSPGQALKLLDQVAGVSPEHAFELIANIFGDSNTGFEIAQVLMNGKMDTEAKWKKCQELLQNIKGEPESNRRIIQGYFHSVMLKRSYSDKTNGILEKALNFSGNYYDSGKLGLLASVYLSC
jgi:DNA polymerase III gamma/tau subunit